MEAKNMVRFQIAREKGILDKKIKEVRNILKSCELCERKCRVDRTKGVGFCKASLKWRIFGAHTHMGEEEEIIPSATLFMAGCTMRCVYCQNAPESIEPSFGTEWTEKEGAEWIERKFEKGCKNVNFVGGDPTPYIYNILKCLKLCKADIPVVWNSNSYYSEKTAQILREIVDLYLLDFRYFNDECAVKLSATPGYVKTAKTELLRSQYNWQKFSKLDFCSAHKKKVQKSSKRNLLIAAKDAKLLVRLLVIPNHIECDAKPILKWLLDNIGADVRVNIMAQYRPVWKAGGFSDINRGLTAEEYQDVVEYAKEIGLNNFITQCV